MKKRILLFVPFLLLTSCKSDVIDVETFRKDRDQKINLDYKATSNKKEFVDDYETFEEFAKENYSKYSFCTLYPKDASRTVVITPISPVYKIGYDSLNSNKNNYFVEIYDVYNDELENMETTAQDSDRLGAHTLEIKSVFYPSINEEKEYTLDIAYSTNNCVRITVNGTKSTLGYVYAYCLTDVSIYKDIFINYVKNNLVYHSIN